MRVAVDHETGGPEVFRYEEVPALLRRADPVIDQVFPLADATKAHQLVESRQAFGRVLLRPRRG